LLDATSFNLIKFTPLIPFEYVGVEKAILSFWRREGLLPFLPKGKWGRLNYVQVLWIWVLNSMREMGVTVKRMQDLKEYFMTRADADNVSKLNLEYHKKRLEDKAMKVPLTVEELELLTIVKRDLQDEQLLKSHQKDINYFSNLVTESIVSWKEAGILIYPDSIVEFVGAGGYRTFPNVDLTTDDLNEPHIRIPLQNFLSRFISKEELSRFIPFYTNLNDKELRVIQEIRNRNIRAISITKGNSGTDLRIDTTKSGSITAEQANKIKEVLGLHNYESITIDTIDDKTLFFKRTQKNIKVSDALRTNG
jgi:hypothetical protein